MNTIGSFRPCCWEGVDDDCLAPALPDSLWCAKHTAWAKHGYDPGMDALNELQDLGLLEDSLRMTAQDPAAFNKVTLTEAVAKQQQTLFEEPSRGSSPGR